MPPTRPLSQQVVASLAPLDNKYEQLRMRETTLQEALKRLEYEESCLRKGLQQLESTASAADERLQKALLHNFDDSESESSRSNGEAFGPGQI